MTTPKQEAPHSGPGLNDILFILFRHKWKILLCTLAGLGAAATYYFLNAGVYESRAKLLVRYVVDRSAIDPNESQQKTASSVDATVINSEVEILTSSDLAVQIVDTLGVDRLLPQTRGATGATKAAAETATKAAAVESVLRGIKVEATKGSDVISVSYRNRDPELARLVLDELVKQYFDKHLEVHRSTGAFDFVSQQTDQVKARLKSTEDELKKLEAGTGIISLADSTANINSSLTKTQDELHAADAELAEQQARVKEMEGLLAGGNASQRKSVDDNTGTPPAPVSGTDVQRYQALVARLADLRKTELEALSKFTLESPVVKSFHEQIDDLDSQRGDLETKFPALLATVPKTASAQAPQADILTERATLAADGAKVEALKLQLDDIEKQAAKLAEVGPQITDLERRKELEEANYKYFESSLEKARVDEALDPSKMPNISIVQKPSTGSKVTGEARKAALGMAGGGMGLGIAIALLIELVLNRSIRRPVELETWLRIPLLVSIPYFSSRSRSRLQLENGNGGSRGQDAGKAIQKAASTDVAPWDAGHFIWTFSQAIRDRLILWFQINNLTHKPKLVGLTGLSGGEGTSTLAASLAAALSETGDGKVLLVDMNPDHSQAYPFLDGKPAIGLSEALEANGHMSPTADNLYLAAGAYENGVPMQLAPKRFYSLLPHLKSSHFDYIIFDMPPVARSSATLAMAGCLDKLLLVVEAEKSDSNEIKRAYGEFVAAKADVWCILNKTRCSGPKWLVS